MSTDLSDSLVQMWYRPELHQLGPGGILKRLPSDEFFSSLKVDPEVLYQKSVTSGEKISQMKTVFEELETIVNKTTQYWMGEAADAHREFFNSAKPDIEEIFKRLSEHARELGEMAATYANVEREVAQLSEDLPSDVII